MMYFGIPLRCKKSSNNWDEVTSNFNTTLKSVYSQTNPNFKILVACHEIPILDQEYDDRVEFHQVDIPFPNNLEEQMKDKGYKVHLIGKLIRDYGAGYTMIVDADDLISNKICEYVHANYNACDGWYVKTGYMYYKDIKTLSVAPQFPSGSNCVIKYEIDELPADMTDAWVESKHDSRFIITKGHDIKVKLEACLEKNKKIRPLPFKGAIYVLGTGDNHSTQNGKRSKIRSILDFFLKVRITSKIKNEFSLT